jgi:probable HAF family extracellular repeat protein
MMVSHQLYASFLCMFDKHRPIICVWLIGLLSSPFAFSIEAGAQAMPVRYTVLDRGPSLVRTLTNTPGLNNHGDFATWQAVSPSVTQGAIIGRRKSIYFQSEGRYALVYPADINDVHVVTGSVQAPQDLRFTQAFRWSDNKLEILQTLGGPYAAGNAINNHGIVTGYSQTATGARHAVRWREHQPEDLGLLAQGDYSAARDINDFGEIVGEANITPNGKPHAFSWQNGHMNKLKDLAGSTFCNAQALNDVGEIVGSCDVPNGTAHGVLWRKSRVEDLGTLGDDDAPSMALDINARAQVVGSSEVVDGKLRAFLWQGGRMYDLNNAIPPHNGWLLLVASRINDAGEIAGRGFYHGTIHAFLLQPAASTRVVAKR